MTTRKEIILKDLKTLLLSNLMDNLSELVLFGSQLSNGSDDSSDFDILIVLEKKIDWKKEREISDLCYLIELKYGIIIDTHILSKEELNTHRGKQPIFQKAISNGYRV